jgi:hypothetical protein
MHNQYLKFAEPMQNTSVEICKSFQCQVQNSNGIKCTLQKANKYF